MSRLLRFFAEMPRQLRWILCFPVGIAASFVVVGSINAGLNAYWGNPRPFPGPIELSTLAFAAALTRTLFPAFISLKPWPVAVVMFTLDFLLRAAPIVLALTAHEYQRARALERLPMASSIIAAGVVGGLIALFVVRRALHTPSNS